MPSLVLSSDALRLSLRSERMVVSRMQPDGSSVDSEVRIAEIDRVVVVGRPDFSFPALYRLLDAGIPCFFVSAKGRWRGSLLPDHDLNAARRIRQYERAHDPEFNLRMARAAVAAKTRNARRVLQRLAANHGLLEDAAYQETARSLAAVPDAVQRVDSVDVVRGIEGLAAARHFDMLRVFFPESLPFPGRNRRPPKDPANALLSFAYTILLGEVEGCIRSHGLDASIGNLHSDLGRSPSLALDLMEPFRPVCDRLVLSLANLGIIDAQKHFLPPDEEGGVYLNEEGRKAFFPVYEQTMERGFVAVNGRRMDIRAGINATVCSYLHALEEEAEPDYFQLP